MRRIRFLPWPEFWMSVRTVSKKHCQPPGYRMICLYQSKRSRQRSVRKSLRSFEKLSVPLYRKPPAHITGYVQNVTAEDLEKHKKEGYTATSIIGKSGLESIYESKLRAVSGCKIIIVDENGDLKDTVAEQKARNGQDIRTTIDIEHSAPHTIS